VPSCVGCHYDILLPEGFTSHLAEIRADFATDPAVRQAGADLDLYGRRKDGTEFPVEVNLGPVRAGSGMEITASVRDVSGRKRSETELRDALSLLSATLESTADGILVVTADGRIAGSNERFASMWGNSWAAVGFPRRRASDVFCSGPVGGSFRIRGQGARALQRPGRGEQRRARIP